MRPGTGDSFLKLIFFAGMWAIAVNALMLGLGWLMFMGSGRGGTPMVVFFPFAYVAAVAGAPIVAARFHQTDRIIGWVFAFSMIVVFALFIIDA